jgi:hypothetical protein
MNFANTLGPAQTLPRVAMATATTLLLALTPIAQAAPGAHGPNGEHLDAPATAFVASTLPRLEAQSEAFELVAELRPNELVIVIDRYETNEPVLRAKLEVESGGLKAVAAFRAEQGDYAITDAAFLKALAAPGEHGLVFTLLAGSEGDLLDGTLVTRAAGAAAAAGHGHDDHAHDDHGHDHTLEYAAWSVGAVLALGLAGAYAWRRKRADKAGALKGAL